MNIVKFSTLIWHNTPEEKEALRAFMYDLTHNELANFMRNNALEKIPISQAVTIIVSKN